MKIASKVLLILELVFIGICVLLHLSIGLAGVAGTYSATTHEEYILCLNIASIFLYSIFIYALPLAFTIYGLVKVNHHKDASNYMLAGFLVLFFANIIPGILMICDASDEKVSEAEDSLFDEIYMDEDCDCCHCNDEECECEECNCNHEEVESKEEGSNEEVKENEEQVENNEPKEEYNNIEEIK